MPRAVDRNDLRDIINTLIAENAGQGPEAMRYVGETILNRAQQRGISPAEVVRQPNQFTGFFAPGPAAVRAQNDPAVWSAAEAAWSLAQGPDDPTGGANHYYAPGTINEPRWARGMTETANFGGHRYLTDRPFTQRALSPSPATQSAALSARRTQPQSYAGQERTGRPIQTSQNLTRVGGIDAAVNAAAQARNPSLQAALNRSVNPQPSALRQAANRAALSIGSNQSFAGQERAPRVASPSSVASIPQSIIERSPPRQAVSAPVPASIDDRVNARNAAAIRQLPTNPLPSVPSAPATTDLGMFPSSLAGFQSPAFGTGNPLVAAAANAQATNAMRLPAGQNPPSLFGAAQVPGLPQPRPAVASQLSVSPQVALPRQRPQLAAPVIAQPRLAPNPLPTIARSALASAPVQVTVGGMGTQGLPTLYRNPLTGALTNAGGANFGTYRAPQQGSLFERLSGSGTSSADNVDRPWSTSQ